MFERLRARWWADFEAKMRAEHQQRIEALTAELMERTQAVMLIHKQEIEKLKAQHATMLRLTQENFERVDKDMKRGAEQAKASLESFIESERFNRDEHQRQKEKLQAEHNEIMRRMEVRRKDLSQENAQIDELQQRIIDRRVELAKVNEDLKTQIRLIEAKARPDTVWVEAFGCGFVQGWKSRGEMAPQLESLSYNLGCEETKRQLAQTVQKQIEKLAVSTSQGINRVRLDSMQKATHQQLLDFERKKDIQQAGYMRVRLDLLNDLLKECSNGAS